MPKSKTPEEPRLKPATSKAHVKRKLQELPERKAMTPRPGPAPRPVAEIVRDQEANAALCRKLFAKPAKAKPLGR